MVLNIPPSDHHVTPSVVVQLSRLIIGRFVVVVFSYFVACARKFAPFIIIGRSSIEEGCVSVAGPHGEQFIFSY